MLKSFCWQNMFSHVYSDSLLDDTDTLACPFAACVNQVPLYLHLYYWNHLDSSVKWYQVYSSLGGKVCVLGLPRLKWLMANHARVDTLFTLLFVTWTHT